MVYNRSRRIARLVLFRHYLLGGEFTRRSSDETLWRWSDGYSARYYHKEQFEDLFRGFFEEASSVVVGQEVDVVPLPRRVRGTIASQIPGERKLSIASRAGGFLFLTASNPLRLRSKFSPGYGLPGSVGVRCRNDPCTILCTVSDAEFDANSCLGILWLANRMIG
jgi:hypothetical protein